ncbi:MBG domain-containing protein [Algoriphagus aquatilis]|uniref:MBG domain-containing protein n=1 Tax=Algoriphagus aquatilis TaxID=490186 RepID=A0ABW0BWV2_9BACT
MNVGSYVITPGGLTSGNYDLTFVPGTLTITKASLTVTAIDDTKVYNGLAYSNGNGVNYSGFVNGENSSVLGGSLTYTGNSQGAVNVGSYVITPGGLTSGNYDLTFVPGTLTITKASLTVTADSKSKIYGSGEPVLTYVVTGLQGGDQLTGSLSRNPGENVGTYAITQGSLSASSNYTIIYVGANLTITSRALTITADPKTKTYGDADPQLTYSVSGLQGGDQLTGSLSRNSGENVGTYAITQGSLTAGSNYTVTYIGANLVINPKPLVITANPNQGKRFGDSDPTLTFTTQGLVSGDVLSGALSRVAGENTGSYPILIGSLAAGSNYTVQFVSAEFIIASKLLTITVSSNQSKVYGDNDPVLTYTASGFEDGDNSSIITGSLSRVPGENVNQYAILLGSISAGNNYTINFVPGVFTITPAPLQIVADAKSKIFGNADPALTFTATGFKRSDTVSLMTGGLVRAAGENVGLYTISQGNLSAGSNYTINYTSTQFEIVKRVLTITANPNQSKTFGTDDPVFLYNVSGLAPGDTEAVISGSLSRVPGENVGSYALLIGSITAGGNYTIQFVPANFLIASKVLTIRVLPDQFKIYGDQDPVILYQVTGLQDGDDLSIISGKIGREVGENVGAYETNIGSLTVSNNYTINFIDADFTIKPKLVRIGGSFTAKNKPFDGNTKATLLDDRLTLIGVLEGDDVRLEGLQIAFVSPQPGTQKVIIINISVAGSDVNNYVFDLDDKPETTATIFINDADGDGVVDEVDLCPNTPRGEAVDENGCSDSQKDSDGDGVTDNLDLCPDTPMGETVDKDGCSASQLDTDGDGVPNSVELLEGTDPINKNEYKDQDGDGVPDYIEGLEGSLRLDPCSYQDTDGDLVPDYVEIYLDQTNPNNPADFKSSNSARIPDYVANRTPSQVIGNNTLTVEWGTELSFVTLPKTIAVLYGNGEIINLPVTWNTVSYDKLKSGTYQFEGAVTYEGCFGNPFNLKVTFELIVKVKNAPKDLLLSNNTFTAPYPVKDAFVGSFTVVDPQDNVHTIQLVPGQKDNAYFTIVNGQLIWTSKDALPGRNEFEIVVRVTDRVGNIFEKTFKIIRLRKPLSEIAIYNSFSPNGDQINDDWGVTELRYWTGVTIRVFERSGKQLFITSNPEVRWDGTFNGKVMTTGAYYFTVEVIESGEKRSGVVNLFTD